MDNCAKDNKNHTFLGLIALLVQAGVVLTAEVIYLLPYHTRMPSYCSSCCALYAYRQRLTLWGHLQMNFLMVGHTHEDIDGLLLLQHPNCCLGWSVICEHCPSSCTQYTGDLVGNCLHEGYIAALAGSAMAAGLS